MKSHLRFEVVILPFCARKERKLSKFSLSEMVQGWDLNPYRNGDAFCKPFFLLKCSRTGLKLAFILVILCSSLVLLLRLWLWRTI
jgi:hypothetical protein